MRILRIFSLLTSVFLGGCDVFTSFKGEYIAQLQGRWNIKEMHYLAIYPNGTTKTYHQQSNAGTLDFYKGEICAYLETCNDFTYNGPQILTNGVRIPMPKLGAASVDAAGKRLIFLLSECKSVIGCDRAWTIEENTAKTQVWSYYKPAAGEAYTDKLKLTLEKE